MANSGLSLCFDRRTIQSLPLMREVSKIYLIFDGGREKYRYTSVFSPPVTFGDSPLIRGGLGALHHFKLLDKLEFVGLFGKCIVIPRRGGVPPPMGRATVPTSRYVKEGRKTLLCGFIEPPGSCRGNNGPGSVHSRCR